MCLAEAESVNEGAVLYERGKGEERVSTRAFGRVLLCLCLYVPAIRVYSPKSLCTIDIL